MLLVSTYLDRSGVHGFGVFARHAIKANAPVWDYTPGIDLTIPMELFASLPPLGQEYLRHYGNLTGTPNEPAGYLLCGDHARFMNHSETPNLHCASEPGYALRDIAAGEEITCDYREFAVNFKGFS